MPTIVGLTGHAGSGKDTAGRFLVEDYGFTRFAFADALKAAALAINPYIFDNERLLDLVTAQGFDFAKRAHPEVRRFLQELGVSMRRIDPDIWLRPLEALAAKTDDPIVVTDVRFDNEAELVAGLGGTLIRLTRPGYTLAGDTGAHISEAGISDDLVDSDIVNDSSVYTLHARLVDTLAHHHALL